MFFTQKFCQNKRSKLKSIKKAKKVVGVLWRCSRGAKNEDEFFSKNSVNFFEKPTSYWNLKKNSKNCKNFFKKFQKMSLLKFDENYLKRINRWLKISEIWFFWPYRRYKNTEKIKKKSQNTYFDLVYSFDWSHYYYTCQVIHAKKKDTLKKKGYK